jgi:Xaa-Pro aminopeptidase
MRYLPLPAKFHSTNRRKLAEAIGKESFAIIDTADVLRRAGDFEHPFRPDSNFYYLTGIDESEAVLILTPGHPNPRLRDVLFLRETSEFTALWEGNRLTQDQGIARSGIQTVLWLSELESFLEQLVGKYSIVYLNAEPSLAPGPLSPSARRATSLRAQLPTHEIKSAVTVLGQMRTVKAPEEVAQIRRAIEITGQGLAKAWAVLKQGSPEYVLEAELTAELTRQSATGSAFSAIIAGGQNATVIHYSTDAAEIGADDLVLFDVGAEAGYYAADISRSVPVSGHFSVRQRAVYEAVHKAQAAGIALHKPGATIIGIDAAMRAVLIKELVALGLITSEQAAGSEAQKHLSQYYSHISHHLGLDVHDTGSPIEELKPGMVVTCEPGLYLAEEGIGVRLEDDILITETGHEVLSKSIPSTPDDIEAAITGSHQ